MAKVLKSFNTNVRRFVAGDDVLPEDITGDVAFEAWVDGGFIDLEPVVTKFVSAPKPPPILADATANT